MEPNLNTDGTGAGSSTATVKVQDTPEFKAELAKAREEHRKNLDAEYARKDAERNAKPPSQPTGDPANWFKGFEERHGVPADAAAELFGAAVGYVQQNVMRPVQMTVKRQELRSQRQEITAVSPRMAALIEQYDGEVMKLLDPMAPEAVGADSYKRALDMVLGSHLEDIEKARGSGEAEGKRNKDLELVTGPQPRGGGTPPPTAIKITTHQQERADAMGLDVEGFVERMRTRARNLLANGKTKEQIRSQLGKEIEGIEF